MTLGVTVVGIVMLTGGTLILIGAVAMTKFQRLYDAAIYRTLGASTRRLAAMVAVEYGVLGTLAGAAGRHRRRGAVLGAGAVPVRDRLAASRPVSSPQASVLTALLVAIVGLVSSADVLVRKPLGTLKGE